jgi:hypothetical protein
MLIDRRTELIAACRENSNKINLDLNKLGNVMNSVAILLLSCLLTAGAVLQRKTGEAVQCEIL